MSYIYIFLIAYFITWSNAIPTFVSRFSKFFWKMSCTVTKILNCSFFNVIIMEACTMYTYFTMFQTFTNKNILTFFWCVYKKTAFGSLHCYIWMWWTKKWRVWSKLRECLFLSCMIKSIWKLKTSSPILDSINIKVFYMSNYSKFNDFSRRTTVEWKAKKQPSLRTFAINRHVLIFQIMLS